MSRREGKQLALSLASRAIEAELKRASVQAKRASNARAALPPGSSRARVTTANARHAIACAEVDRLEAAQAWAWQELERDARGDGWVPPKVRFVGADAPGAGEVK